MKKHYDYIFSFDPGVKTGYVMYSMLSNHIIDHKILTGYSEIYDELELIKTDYSDSLVIYERNVGKVITPDQLNMVKKVGLIEGYCVSNQIDLVGQVPSVRKGYLKTASAFFKSDFNKNEYEIHNVDALSHIFRYVNVNK